MTPWIVAHQAALSMGYPRQEYLSGRPFPSPGDLPDSGIEPIAPALTGESFTIEPPGKPPICDTCYLALIKWQALNSVHWDISVTMKTKSMEFTFKSGNLYACVCSSMVVCGMLAHEHLCK